MHPNLASCSVGNMWDPGTLPPSYNNAHENRYSVRIFTTSSSFLICLSLQTNCFIYFKCLSTNLQSFTRVTSRLSQGFRVCCRTQEGGRVAAHASFQIYNRFLVTPKVIRGGLHNTLCAHSGTKRDRWHALCAGVQAADWL
jgi:hypothetical protein